MSVITNGRVGSTYLYPENGRMQLPVRALEMLHLVFVSKTSRAKSSCGRNSASIVLSPHLLSTQFYVFAVHRSTPGLCTCCTIRVQPAGTEHSASEQLIVLPNNSVLLPVV